MIGYHVTSSKKYKRYIASGAIFPPVRFWTNINSAKNWRFKTGRTLILKIKTTDNVTYPLPDHKPKGCAWWADEFIREFEIVEEGLK
jgi:hypothetical protein